MKSVSTASAAARRIARSTLFQTEESRSPVGRPVFKTGWGRQTVPGGFDSRTLPPNLTARERRLKAATLATVQALTSMLLPRLGGLLFVG